MPFQGPRESFISSAWRARALQSFMMVKPKMASSASRRVQFRSGRPMTAATSSS